MNEPAKTAARRWLFLGLAIAVAIAAGRGVPYVVDGFVPVLNRQREELGLSGHARAGDVSPGLALVVTASGPARAIAINILWLRATRLQDEGKFFELNELCRMITVLEPRLPMVWAHWAWNLAYNVSVKFPEDQPHERWRWICNGIDTLRDRGIRHNPKAYLLYRELAWIHDHKIGGNSDEAHVYYKIQLAADTERVLGAPPYRARLEAIADAPRSPRLLDRPTRDLLQRIETAGLDPLTHPLDVVNRTELPEPVAALLDQASGSPELDRLDAFLRGYYLRRTLKMEPGDVAFARGDVLDWPGLAAALARGADAAPCPATRLWSVLPPHAHKILELAAQGDPLDEPTRDRLLLALNDALARRDLYDKRAFRRTTIPIFMHGYLDAGLQALDEQQVRGLNRALLHAAFPDQLAPAGLMLRLTRCYGPIDWRLPDAHSLYWAAAGLDVLGLSVEKAANTDRIAFHALTNLYRRGRLRFQPPTDDQPAMWMGSPNFAFITPVLELYDDIVLRYKNTGQEDPTREGYLNFLRQVVVDLYVHNDLRSSAKYFKMLTERGPESGRLDDFIADRVLSDIKTPTRDHFRNIIQGYLYQSLQHAALGDNNAAAGLEKVVAALWARFERDHAKRIKLPPKREIWKAALLDAVRTFPPLQRDKLRELFPDEVKEAEAKLRDERERRDRARRDKTRAAN